MEKGETRTSLDMPVYMAMHKMHSRVIGLEPDGNEAICVDSHGVTAQWSGVRRG